MRKKKELVLALLILVFVTVAEACTQFKLDSKIRIRRNGYTEIVVAIEESVEEDHMLIERIKESFIEASELLFNITKKRVFFREIFIIVPSTWKLEYYYDDFNTDSYDGRIPNATWESYDRGDFCIENRDFYTIDQPFVVNYATQCGRTASHVSLTPDYFLNKNRAVRLYGPYAKVLVHNWAQFRYGVFNEYPQRSLDESKDEFYLNERGEIEATRCSGNLTGRVRNPMRSDGVCNEFNINGLPSDECIYQDDDIKSDDSGSKMGSLMYKPFLTQLTEFCDNNPDNHRTYHNKLAPTVQNMECNRRSVWEVMRSHEDFKDYKNMPNNVLKSVVPKFQLLKNRFKKVVLLIDRAVFDKNATSGSKAAERAIKDYIKLMLGDGTMIGVIHFEHFAKVAVGMTPVRDSPARKRILNTAIPVRAAVRKKSNIWNAISLGLTLLRTTLDASDKTTPSGGRLVIITNTMIDDKYPNRNTIIEQVKQNEATLDLLRFGEEPDLLLDLIVSKSDGKSFLIDDKNHLMDLDDTLAYISNRETKNLNKAIELVNTHIKLDWTPIPKKTGYIYIDEGVSSRTDSMLRLTFHITNINEYIEIIVYEPTNRKHESKYNVKCKDSSLFLSEKLTGTGNQEVVCEFKRPKLGKWVYEIVNVGKQQNVQVSLKAYVFFYFFVDETSYYSNYYDSEDFRNRRAAAEAAAAAAAAQSQLEPSGIVEENGQVVKPSFHSTIRLDAQWRRVTISYPQGQVIYASVSKGLKPILNASVRALIFRPGGDVLSLELHDNGLNSDRFKNDGVYSRQFSNFDRNGVYHARIEVSSNEYTRVNMQKIVGQSDIEHYPTIGIINKLDADLATSSIDEFQRTLNLGHFVLTNFTSDLDMIKPSKIKDLRLVESDLESKVVKIVFTAPGDDADLGTALYYDIKCSYDLDYLIKYENRGSNNNVSIDSDSDNLDEHILPISLVSSSFKEYKPNQGGSREHFVLNTDIYSSSEDIVGIKLRAVDASGNLGPWSNLAVVKLNGKVKFSPQLRQASAADVAADEQNRASALSTDSKTSLIKLKEDRYFYYFMIFIACLSLILLVQIVMIVILTLNKLRDAREAKGKKGKPVGVTKDEFQRLEDSVESSESSPSLLIQRV